MRPRYLLSMPVVIAAMVLGGWAFAAQGTGQAGSSAGGGSLVPAPVPVPPPSSVVEPAPAPAQQPRETVAPKEEPAAKESKQAKPHVVKISSAGFEPKSLTVKPGDTVEWKNESKSAQSVTADITLAKNKKSVKLPKGAAAFSSGDIAPGKTFSYTFTTVGSYKYVSLPHEAKMSGTVTVKEEAAKKPAAKAAKAKKGAKAKKAATKSE